MLKRRVRRSSRRRLAAPPPSPRRDPVLTRRTHLLIAPAISRCRAGRCRISRRKIGRRRISPRIVRIIHRPASVRHQKIGLSRRTARRQKIVQLRRIVRRQRIDLRQLHVRSRISRPRTIVQPSHRFATNVHLQIRLLRATSVRRMLNRPIARSNSSQGQISRRSVRKRIVRLSRRNETNLRRVRGHLRSSRRPNSRRQSRKLIRRKTTRRNAKRNRLATKRFVR